jgi:hypothetical protein
MKKDLNYLASKRWEKVGCQELRSTPYKQEKDPWCLKLILLLVAAKKLVFLNFA